MPLMTSFDPCKKCGEEGKKFRLKKTTNKSGTYYLQSTCKDCEALSRSKWFKDNKDKTKIYNREAHLRKVGSYKRTPPRLMTREKVLEGWRRRANKRSSRVRKARFTDELTSFVIEQAHELRIIRNKLTGFKWNVDHVIPLNNSKVCGLHIWNNIAVIPEVDNLRKGNSYPANDL